MGLIRGVCPKGTALLRRLPWQAIRLLQEQTGEYMKKLFAFALAASSVALVSAPAMAWDTGLTWSPVLDYANSDPFHPVEVPVGKWIIGAPFEDEWGGCGGGGCGGGGFFLEACRYPVKWGIGYGFGGFGAANTTH